MSTINRIALIFLAVLAILMFGHGIYKGHHHHHHRQFGHKHGGSMLSVDYYAYASHLRKWNAALKVFCACSVLVLCIALNNLYVSLFVILMMGYITVVIGGLEFDHYVSMMTIPIVFLLVGSLAIAVGFSLREAGEYHIHVFNLFYVYWSKASVLKACNLIFKALGAVSALYMMTLTTPLSELISVLRRAHIPQVIVELMNMIYRYIFIMLDTHSRMTQSAESRLGYIDFKTACYSFGQVASNLLVVSLKKGNDYYNALESRCYNGELLFLEEDKPVAFWQYAFIAAIIMIMIALKVVTG